MSFKALRKERVLNAIREVLAQMKSYGHLGKEEAFVRGSATYYVRSSDPYGYGGIKSRNLAIAAVWLAYKDYRSREETEMVRCLGKHLPEFSSGEGRMHFIGAQEYFEDYFSPITTPTIRKASKQLKKVLKSI